MEKQQNIPLKYTEAKISFSEIPEQISLSINIANCPHKCEKCHSPHLQQNIGKILSNDEIDKLVKKYKHITTITLLGGSANIPQINQILNHIKSKHKNKLTALYLGDNSIPQTLNTNLLNFIKIGEYIPKLGDLTSPTTNQKLLKINKNNQFVNITHKLKPKTLEI